MEYQGLMAVLMDIFPCLRSMEGDKRQLQYKLITEQFEFVDWKLSNGTNSAWIHDDDDSKLSKKNPYYFGNEARLVEGSKVIQTYAVVKFNKVQMRGRRVVTLAPQYAVIYRQPSASAPVMRCYENTFVETGEWGNNFNGSLDGWDKPLHPHIQGHTPCLGSFENLMFKESLTNPVGYFSLVSKFYRTWNSASPYWSINEMAPLYELKYNDEGQTVRGGIILTALEHEKFRQSGMRSAFLQDYVPVLKKAGLHISRMYLPCKILSCISSRLPDILYGYYYSYLNDRAALVNGYKDIWGESYRALNELSRNNFKFFDEVIPNTENRRLMDMYQSMDFYLTSKLVDNARDRWDESLKEHGTEIIEHIMAFDVDYLWEMYESSSEMEVFLFRDDVYKYWGMDEEEAAETLSVSIPFTAMDYKEDDGEFERFWPEEVMELRSKAKYDCGKAAIKKLETKRTRILNEIRTLHTNPIESAILQQEISF